MKSLKKNSITIGIYIVFAISLIGIGGLKQFLPELSNSWGAYIFGYAVFLLLGSIGYRIWLSWASIKGMCFRLLAFIKSWWEKVQKVLFLMAMVGIAMLIYYWAYLNISTSNYLALIFAYLGLVTIPFAIKHLEPKTDKTWARLISRTLTIGINVILALIFPALLFIAYIFITSLFFFIPLATIILVASFLEWNLDIQTACFVCFILFSVSIVHLSTYTKKLIYAVLPLVDVTIGYSERFRKFTDYVLQKEILHYVVYGAYAIFLFVLGVKELSLGSPVFSAKTDRVLMLSFLVYIAINNMVAKGREVNISIDDVFDKFIHIFKE